MTSLLVTGGTGSFGHAFTRHALDSGLSDRVCIYSRDELKQFEMRNAFGNDPRLRWFIGDMRDRDRLRRALDGVETVIHAAALKRVEVGQYNPGEMKKTNVDGATNLIEAATDAGVAKVVSLSSDKACQPVNAYGASKAMMEHLILAANNARGADGPRFAVTRYGNVAGSRGSIIPIWRRQRDVGEPLTVTDPSATRFWMTMAEAVELVRWTLDRMQGGELVVPDLPAYEVGDLLQAIASPTSTAAWTGGLGHGEKNHESMLGPHDYQLFRKEGPYWSTHGTGVALTGPLSSDKAVRLSVEELRQRLVTV